MPSDLLRAYSFGLLLLRDSVPEGARIELPFLRYDPSWSDEDRAEVVDRLLARAEENRVAGRAPLSGFSSSREVQEELVAIKF